EVGQSKAVLIENKVFHTVNNDLADYYNSFAHYAEKMLIVLTLHPTSIPTPVGKKYFNVTHIDWINAIRRRLGAYVDRIDVKDMSFLQDFIQHVESFYKKNLDMEAFKFLFDYAAKIEALNQLQQYAKAELIDNITKNLFNGWWEYWCAVASFVVLRNGACLVLYVASDARFPAGDYSYILELWIRGATSVKKWPMVTPLPEIE